MEGRVEDNLKPERAERADGELSRRDFVRGAAATGLIVVGAGYVKPVLKHAGVTQLSGATSIPHRHGGGLGDGGGDDGGDGDHGDGEHGGHTGHHDKD
jgi:hypothetical protein